LTLFLAGWTPLALMAVVLLGVSGSLSWREAVIAGAPPAVLYGLICRSSLYVCRASPLEEAGTARVFLIQAAAAGVSAWLWVVMVQTSGKMAGEDLRQQLPLLAAIGVSYYLLAAAYHYVVIAVRGTQEAERRALEARVLARDSELKALKAQINPHFLFNSLHSISSLAGSEPARARQMSILLGDFLRMTLGMSERSSIGLGEELELIRKYLAIEQIRFGDRLRLEEEIDEQAMGCVVPPLVLQPLVENAVRHGVATMTEGGWMRLKARRNGASVVMALENGFDEEAPSKRGAGVGLQNTRRRLETLHGNRAWLETRRGEGVFRAEVGLPAEPGVGHER
jgi:two-component system sensor histidine kinase AlgZ